MSNPETESRSVARAAVLLAVTETRDEENRVKADLLNKQLRTAAADFGGEYLSSVMKIVERAVVCARREGLIGETHHEEGAVAGAAREALAQVAQKAIGLSVGGKIAVARGGEHIAVAVFFSIGLGHLNEICIGMGHRAV